MSSFNARFRLSGQSRIFLGVLVDVAGECITVTAADREIARWKLGEVKISHLQDGFHIQDGGEEGVLGVTEPTGFATAVGIGTRPHRLAEVS